ncbi:MAG: alkaline phosphatase [Pseudomonadota bacterium]|nr:alkaline phosphatase [Pseudomonadota bacterium]
MLLLLALSACTGKQPADDGPELCESCDDTSGDTTTDSDTGDSDSGDSGTGDSDSGESGADDSGDTLPPLVPPRVILFVGDGMGFPHVRGGGIYAYGAEGSLVMETLPNQGRLLTASLTGVTDSAAGATALSSGVKTWNYVVGMDRELAPVTTILEEARSRGLAVGVVTTDTLTGATPSSFYAHTDSRGNTTDIAEQLVAEPPDVVFGGGLAALREGFSTADVQFVETRTAFKEATPDGRPFIGLFADWTLPYVDQGYVDQPTLAEMTAVAIDVLDDDPDGFFLIVEGARIDHASHANDDDRVHLETAAFDEAVTVASDWAEGLDVTPTIVVTADHECGGLEVLGGGPAGTIPESEWRWGNHTNADIPVFAMGDLTAVFDGQRLDNTWVHAVLLAAVTGAATVTAPLESLLVDGRTTDLGAPVTTQLWETSFGAGYNQLDALRVTSDTDGLWVGVDGVFEYGENAVLLLVDLDYGAGTGWGADETTLEDTDGQLDALVTAMPYTSGVPGLGFDLVFGTIGAEELATGDLSEVGGVRGLHGEWGSAEDYWWLYGTSNFDDGNLADGAPARDADATGATTGGWELQLPWFTVYPAGLPPEGMSVAIVAVLLNADGTIASNQALPPFAEGTLAGGATVFLESAVRIELDGSGVPVGPASVVP